MAEEKENQMIVWGSQEDSGSVPDYLRKSDGEGPKGYENVESTTMTSLYLVSQGQSKVVSEGGIAVGRIYEINDRADLGTERIIVPFMTRNVREHRVNKGRVVACKAYDIQKARGPKGTVWEGTGRVRLRNKEDIPPEIFEKWGLTTEDIENNRSIEIDCLKCPFSSWRTDEKKRRIPPDCKLGYEVYFLDITDIARGTSQSLDFIPRKIALYDRNAPARESYERFQSLSNMKTRVQGIDLWGGTYRLVVAGKVNDEGQSFFVPEFKWDRYLPQEAKMIAEICERYFDEFQKRKEEFDAAEEHAGDEEDTGSDAPPVEDDVEVTKGTWGGDDAPPSDKDAPPEEDKGSPW